MKTIKQLEERITAIEEREESWKEAGFFLFISSVFVSAFAVWMYSMWWGITFWAGVSGLALGLTACVYAIVNWEVDEE